MADNVNFGKRGQMKIQQMAFMLIAITLLFIIVGLFVVSTSFSNLKAAKEELNEREAAALVLSISNYPEFSCGDSYGQDMPYCIDSDKFMAFKSVAEKDYSSFWEISSIEIRTIYNESNVVCTASNYPNCGIYRATLSGNQGSDKTAFVTLCKKESYMGTFYNKCEIAKLIVRFEDVD